MKDRIDRIKSTDVRVIGSKFFADIEPGYAGGSGGLWSFSPNINPLSVGLMAYWPLNSLLDGSGRGHTLTNNNAASFVVDGSDVVASLEAASSQYFSLADHADLSTGDIAFTIGGFFKANSVSGNAGLFCKNASVAIEYMANILGNQPSLYVKDLSTYVQPDVVTASAWHSIWLWHDPISDLIWSQVDSHAPVSAVLVGGPVDTAGAFVLGREPIDDFYFDGLLKRWSFWKRLLTSDERSAYAGGSSPL